MRRLSIDFETASLVDLRRAGVYSYSRDPSTRVLCMAWAFDDDPVKVWREGEPFPQEVLDHVYMGRPVRGWNLAFEFNVWNHTLMRQLGHSSPVFQLSLSQLEDTMAAAAYWGLPLTLDAAGPAAGVQVYKDKEGHALMLRMTRPRYGNPVTGEVRWWHEEDPEKFDRLCAYCVRDVEVERAVAASIPGLPQDEARTWVLDQRINSYGVGVDYDMVARLRDLAREAAERGNQELQRITNGQVMSVNANKAFLEWLQFHGYPYDNLRRATVEQRLDETGLSDLERRALEIRADVARTSAAKLNAMLDASPVRTGVGPVRGMLQYYGANRTGRWAGRLIQLQNMPRGSIKNIDAALNMIAGGADYEMIEALFGPVMAVVSSCLRGCIVARPGKKLVVADFSQIEARMVAWLAGQLDVLAVFASGRDNYIYTASRVTGIPEATITKDSPLRQLGKVLVLACGFGMAWRKFRESAAGYGVILTDEEAEKAVAAWRTANDKIVQFWWDCDRAAKTVLANPALTVDVGHVRFGMWGPHMLIRLPSGRNLVYRNAQLRPNPDRPGDHEITYMGTNQYTRRWERLRTYGGKLVENITQAAARDVMRDAMLECDKQGIPLILTVHDELLAEDDAARADASLNTMLSVMATAPAWAPGLPVKGEGWVGERYKK